MWDPKFVEKQAQWLVQGLNLFSQQRKVDWEAGIDNDLGDQTLDVTWGYGGVTVGALVVKNSAMVQGYKVWVNVRLSSGPYHEPAEYDRQDIAEVTSPTDALVEMLLLPAREDIEQWVMSYSMHLGEDE